MYPAPDIIIHDNFTLSDSTGGGHLDLEMENDLSDNELESKDFFTLSIRV